MHYTFAATTQTGRAGTLHVDPEHPIHGTQGWFSLDKDPGIGPISEPRALVLLTITGGPAEGLRKLAAWGRSSWAYGRTDQPWMVNQTQWADAVAALADAS